MEESIDSDSSHASDRESDSANVDKRGRLGEEIFSYRESKDKVFIFWHNKQVMILKGQQARKFLDKIAHLDGKEAQLVLAKITGNFKHGNER
jgi:hypothetical protein